MTGWYAERTPGRSAKGVIAVALLALVLVAAVPVALLAGVVMMVLGHVVGGRAHRCVITRAGGSAMPVRDDRQVMHPAAPQGRPDRVAAGPEQPALLRRGQAAGRPRGVYPGAPQDLVGQQVADARDPVLIHDPRLDRRGAARQRGPELGWRDQLG